MILGLLVCKPHDDARKALDSLNAACDETHVELDETDGRWERPEWALRQPLVDAAIAAKADWAVSLDSDEWLTDPEYLRDYLKRVGPGTSCVWLRRFNLWGGGMVKADDQCRCWRPKDGQIIERRHVGTASCPNSVAHEGRGEHIAPDRCAIIHEGYAARTDRFIRAEEYAALDPEAKQMKRDMRAYFNDIDDAFVMPDYIEEAIGGPR